MATLIDAPSTPSIPPEVTWRVVPGELEAHAFSSGAGWMYCACRAKRWTVLTVATNDAPRNEECQAIVAGEISPLELHAMGGNH